ncbi:CGNR zinc finger domain-containing protein [Nocardia sp. NPDC101769]|uniref:CGNR zinc finger domain-containing protein n=1 Tax=Nocardia sp. NPDC101769 TaxID=3364333 RepID=UPI0037FA7A81
MTPGEPLPIRLMNTIRADRHGVHDALTTPANLHAWLVAVAPEFAAGHSPGPDRIALGDFRALRDALRRLAALQTDDARPAAAAATTDPTDPTDAIDAIAAINDAATLVPVVPQLELREGQLSRATTRPATSALRVLSGIAREGIELLTGPTRIDLRACHAPGCLNYFVKDHPRREWCSPACGNRARSARHYHRHTTQPDTNQ